MSYRSSFVTEYIDCWTCFKAAERVLVSNEKYLKGVTIPHWNGNTDEPLPIIAGKIGGLYIGEELDTFSNELIPRLEEVICHDIRIAILHGHGEAFLTAKPKCGEISKRLIENRVMKVSPTKDGKFEVVEMCDRNFGVTLTAEQLAEFGAELIQISLKNAKDL